jgi:hypothetical protein
MVLLIALTALAFTPMVLGQPTQVTSTVNLTYLTVQLSYPSEVTPGDSVTVNVQGTANGAFQLGSLAATTYYASGSGLQQVSTATIASNQYMASGDKVSKDIRIVIPSDAPRTSLFAVVSESVMTQNIYYGYYDFPYYAQYYNYSSHHHHYSSLFIAAYPAYYSTTTTDQGVAPLSYIKATTPEYVQLQSQYNSLQQQLNQTQSQNNQLQSQNGQLQQQLQNQQNLVNQKDAQINDLNNRIISAQATIQELEIAAVILAIAIAVVGLVAWRVSSSRRKQETQTQPQST